MTEIRTFDSNAAAFEFACEHLDCSLKDGRAVLAIVLGVQGRICTVKIANPNDKSIPTGSLNALLAQADSANICFSAMLADKVPDLATGDLALYTTMPELAAAGKTTVVGTLTSRVNPHHSSKTGWQPRVDESKLAAAQASNAEGDASGAPQDGFPCTRE